MELWINSVLLVGDVDVDVPWLSVSPESGSAEPGDGELLTVSIDTSGLEPGQYTAEVALATDAGRTPRVTVPVSVEVTGTEPLVR